MLIGRVVGEVTASVKFRKYEGKKLLQVQPLSLKKQLSGYPLTAIDLVDAGPGDEVLVCREGKSAIDALELGMNPVDAVILAVVDRVRLEDRKENEAWNQG